jgi:GNAT superfamily N-acetyltransferase
MEKVIMGRLQPSQWDELSALISTSLDHWYSKNLNRKNFTAGPASMRFFPEIYEDLDPGCCVTATCPESGQIAGACFYHPRETHLSLGIMAVHPEFGGLGIARAILDVIVQLANDQNLPIRLVSSAMNLDSFSLYSKAGFVPRESFQDLLITVPESGLAQAPSHQNQIRSATLNDIARMVALERELVGISREQDYLFFVKNKDALWHTLIAETSEGEITGFLCSIDHPNMRMLGPGVSRREETSLALIHHELHHSRRGQSLVFLVPTSSSTMVKELYLWGARNIEIHFSQALGKTAGTTGIVIPTFMPESG